MVAKSFAANSAPETDQLWRQISTIEQNINKLNSTATTRNQQHSLFSDECGLSHPDNELARALKAESQLQQSNKGLSFRGGYTSDNLQDKNDEANAYLELSWDLWRQGYSEFKHRANSLQHQATIAKLKAQLEQQKLNDKCRRYRISQSFTGLLSQFLALKLSLMEPVYNIERRAYFKNWSYLDDLLVSEQDIKLLREELSYIHSNPYLDSSLNNISYLPIINVDINAIIQAIREDDRLEQIFTLEKKALTDKINLLDDDRLRFFVRKQFDIANNNDNGVVAGLRFSIPFKNRLNLAEKYRLSHLDQQKKLQTWERISRTRTAYQKLREQLQRATKQQYRVLRATERMRRSFVQQKLHSNVELASAITRVKTVLDANIELVRAKEELYRRSNDIFLVSNIQYNKKYIRLHETNKANSRSRQGERSIYLWSKGFNRYANETIIDFLQAKNIKRVLLTAGRIVQRDKMKKFIKIAQDNNIYVESIVGSNKFFFKENHLTAAITVEIASSLSDAIHLDVEPHTFPDYKKNKKAYLEQYINMLHAIRKQSPNITLTVAIPFHWSSKVYTQIAGIVDRVYIMAYGSTKPETIARRLQPALQAIPHDKIVVVLRVTDFDDEWAIEKMITALKQQTNIQKYSLHTFRRFIQQAGKQ